MPGHDNSMDFESEAEDIVDIELGDEGPEFAGGIEWQIADDMVGRRLDVFLAEALPDATRAEAQRLIDLDTAEVGVWVNDRRSKANYRLREGDHVRAVRPAPAQASAMPESIPLSIVYEDSEVLVINKPRGMVVHPAPGAESGTLVNAILGYAANLSGIGGTIRPGIVHRLDKDTSGLLVVAKNDIAHRALQSQIQARTASRRYLALVWGAPNFKQALVDAPIGRHPGDRKKMAVITDEHYHSRTAQTEMFVLESFEGVFTLVEARLRTGRTHQIRVHCAYIHHPVVGDPQYGGERRVPSSSFAPARRAAIENAISMLKGQALHAYSLAIDQPVTGERLQFEAPLPPEFQDLMNLLRDVPDA